ISPFCGLATGGVRSLRCSRTTAFSSSGVQLNTTPAFRTSALNPRTGSGGSPASVTAALDSPADLPFRFFNSTKYFSTRGGPDASEEGSASEKELPAPGAIVTVPASTHGPTDSCRQTRAATAPLIISLSVFFLGVFQESDTWSPARTADKSFTRSGRFSEGGCGAPGVPH